MKQWFVGCLLVMLQSCGRSAFDAEAARHVWRGMSQAHALAPFELQETRKAFVAGEGITCPLAGKGHTSIVRTEAWDRDRAGIARTTGWVRYHFEACRVSPELVLDGVINRMFHIEQLPQSAGLRRTDNYLGWLKVSGAVEGTCNVEVLHEMADVESSDVHYEGTLCGAAAAAALLPDVGS